MGNNFIWQQCYSLNSIMHEILCKLWCGSGIVKFLTTKMHTFKIIISNRIIAKGKRGGASSKLKKHLLKMWAFKLYYLFKEKKVYQP